MVAEYNSPGLAGPQGRSDQVEPGTRVRLLRTGQGFEAGSYGDSLLPWLGCPRGEPPPCPGPQAVPSSRKVNLCSRLPLPTVLGGALHACFLHLSS